MRKIELLEHEQIVHKVKFSNKSILFTFLLFILFTIIYDYIPKEGFSSIVAFLFMFIFVVPTLFKLLFSLYRRVFQRIYITNNRIIVVNGYLLKFFKTYMIQDVTGVYYKAKRLDKVNNAASIKVTFKNQHYFVFKKVKYGNEIARILSDHLNK